MSLFDNVRNIPDVAGINLFIKLKYGQPNHTDEYFNSLPEVVISAAAKKAGSNTVGLLSRQILSIMLRQPINQSKAKHAIHEALVEYHTLLG